MVNWTNIRPVNTSQRTGFEKLCCQLAAYEVVPYGSFFIPKGDPDAGVECYWKLLDNSEWGWQAKFFLSTPNGSQWGQIDRSVKKALEKHPNLKRYYICIPLDRSDPRKDYEEHFMDKWEAHVEKWERWAEDEDMDVEYIYWGETELLDRLSREELRGKYLFWFNEEKFSNSWFNQRISDTITNVGPRYSPELNVELPISFYFDCLGRTEKFYERRFSLFRKIKKNRHLINSAKIEKLVNNEFNQLQKYLDTIISIIRPLESPMEPINFDLISKSAKDFMELAENCINTLNSNKNGIDDSVDNPKSFAEDIKQTENNYWAFIRIIRKVKSFADSYCSILANKAALLLDGDAGVGKTHLLCDIAERRLENEQPTVLLLGGHFNDNEPWSQIIRQLGLQCDKDEFLGALEAAAQIKGSRALILIDALNEGTGLTLWREYIAGMLNTLERYPWIGLAISVRDSYLKLVIPEQALAKLVYIKHEGFSANEYHATEKFFEYYGIKSPQIPLLNPEFSNPLFLKIFCESLKNRGLTEIPEKHGISSIFDYYIQSIDRKLSHPDYLDFDQLSSPVKESITKITEIMADKQVKWLPRAEAKGIIDEVLESKSYENSLFRHLISEGILTEDLMWNDDEPEHIIRFTYERFTDYMITEFMLKENLNIDNPIESFSENKPLGLLFKDGNSIYFNIGFIESLFVLIPEQTGHELGEIIPDQWNLEIVRDSFLKSLFWRDLDSFSDKTKDCINEVIKYEDSLNRFMRCLLTFSLNIKHPYNSKMLHRWLNQFEVAERDELWSIVIHKQYSNQGVLNRLLDWALNFIGESEIDEEVLFLYGIVLGWFLTTSNRYVRDKATKAIVNLFSDHISILNKVIAEFIGVNDPYILERLFAAGYGCAMRSNDLQGIAKLAGDTYTWIFDKDEVYPHILLRDYARGILELALIYGLLPNIDLDKIIPPYNSKFPYEIPTDNRFEDYCKCADCEKDEIIGCKMIYDSVMSYGDFSRYVIGTNFGSFEWSSNRMNEPSQQKKYDKFVCSLTEVQKEYWNDYWKARNRLRKYEDAKREKDLYTYTLDIFSKNPESFLKTFGETSKSGVQNEKIRDVKIEESDSKTEIYDFLKKELENRVDNAANDFMSTLWNKRQSFEKEFFPYMISPYEIDSNFDQNILQRLIYQKVFDLGWSMKKFGYFDRFLNYNSNTFRSARKPERIGKKYQWIAYHEFLARVSDNFVFKPDYDDSKYNGPWQIHVRDIDPSCLLLETETEKWEPNSNKWWFPVSYENWGHENDVEWVKSTEKLPNFLDLIEVVKPEDGSKWLNLDSIYTWEEPHPPEEERFESPRGNVQCSLNSYIVKKSDMMDLWDWCNKQDYRSMEMPQTPTLRNTFFGEFFWSPSFKDENVDKWTSDGERFPCEVLGTTIDYFSEMEYDCSVNDSYSITFPTTEIFSKIGLQWSSEGYFVDKNKDVICFNPSVDDKGPNSFLIKKDEFINFLNDNDYEILWILMGEKLIIGDHLIKNRLEIMGVYKLNENEVVGELKTEFKSH